MTHVTVWLNFVMVNLLGEEIRVLYCADKQTYYRHS
jgi:hypothetical protein